ncbi:hypothetical protein BT96DRAFT_993439 [Gymnopus androsaceus JB14]|uniref:Uncharacterized protein n=1 Tax=Gymnopus androsaceus JB14 TaxID=1447944 RepID=A0A6A4HM19_9AGAR|nr:hypothetical protein BT96DRAFT_993439 [Gymnopus androsaceus JB14]
MPDPEFAKHLVMLMTSDEDWHYCRDHLREKMKEAEAAGTPYSSRQVVQRLREEEIHKGISALMISVNAILAGKRGKQTDNPLPGAYSVNSPSSSTRQQHRAWHEYYPRVTLTIRGYKNLQVFWQMYLRVPAGFTTCNQALQQHQSRRTDRKPKPYPGANEKKKICGNEFCGYPIGHTVEECFAYNGGSAGKYPDWYKGLRRIHLSPDTRAADRRKEMLKKVGASTRMAEPEDETGDPSRDKYLLYIQ